MACSRRNGMHKDAEDPVLRVNEISFDSTRKLGDNDSSAWKRVCGIHQGALRKGAGFVHTGSYGWHNRADEQL